MSFIIYADRVFEDSEGIYFEKRKGDLNNHELIGKVRPSEIGFFKTLKMEIYVEKSIQSENALENQTIVFSQTLTVSIPEEKRFKYVYLFKVKNGSILQKDFESGCSSAVSINDSELVHRGKAKRVPNDTYLRKDAPFFIINKDGFYERRLEAQNPFT